MQVLYFTPASIGFLTQLILSLAATLYLFYRCIRNRARQNAQTVLLTGVFAASTLFVGLLFLDTTVLPAPRLVIVYLENTVLAVVLVLLFQFAYRFPEKFSQRRWEARVVLAFSLLYLLYEAGFAVYRFWLLLGQGLVEYRVFEADYVLMAVLAWVPIAFLRQCLAADPRSVSAARKLWRPQGSGANGARSFAFVVILLLGLDFVSLLADSTSIPIAVFNAFLSLGILIAIWLFVTVYLNFVPENTSFLIKLSGVMLTLLLAVLGLVGWVVSPAYVAAFRPTLTDHQTLRFTPTSTGGYDISQQPMAFEAELGDRLPLTSRGHEARNHPITFTFPFEGKTYSTIYATSGGALSLGHKLYHPNLQADYTAFPDIFPLLIDLRPENGGGVFARVEPDRLIVTWDHIPALDEPEAIYTFQTVLYEDGRFDFTYNGLPEPLTFAADTQPSAFPWLRGVTSGAGGPIEQVEDLAQSRHSPHATIVQDFYRDFRQHLSDFITPLAWLILGGSLLIIVGLPVLINSNMLKPLSALLAGVRRVESGDLTVEMPVQHRDEIGSLTASFNAMTAQLRQQVADLEQRVAERTAELQVAIARLKAEVHEREQAEAAVRASEALYHQMFAIHSAIKLLIEPETGAIVEANRAAVNFYGYPADVLQHMNIEQINTLTLQEIEALRQEVVAGRRGSFCVPHRLASGEIREVEVNSSPIRVNDRVLLYSIIHDVTERKRAESQREAALAALQESEARYRVVAQSASDAIISADSAGCVVGWNRGAEAIFGYSEAAAMGQPLTRLMPGQFQEAHLTAMARMRIDGEKPKTAKAIEMLGRRSDGREFPLEMSLADWRMADNQFYTAIIRDITERKQAEEALRLSQIQVAEQQLVVAVLEERERMARELHDGIGQILGYVNVQAQAAHTLLDKNQSEAAQKNIEGLVQVVQDAHANLRHTILGLRDSVPPQRNLCQALQAYLESFSQAWNIKTSFSPPQHDLPVLPAAVEDQLLHIVQEALVNIRKHAQARQVEVFMTLRPGELTLIISDDGQGFDPQLAPGVKEEHFGLSIMRERAEQVGGWLEIRSASGRGTQVLVYIPYLTTPATEDNPKDVYSLRLLLVDDQPLFLEGLRNLLKARGLTVIGMAHDGLEACEQVKALRPDVVLMDVHMPRCDGIEATRRIKTEFPETHVVLLTVSEDDEHLVDAVKYGAASYLLKTLDADRLFATLGGLARGEIQLAPEMAARLLAEFNRAGTAVQLAADGPDAIPGELTLRQWEVLRLVARGLTYKEAGRELHVTEQAIKYHMAQVLDRLQVKNREQAVAYLRQVEARTQKKGS